MTGKYQALKDLFTYFFADKRGVVVGNFYKLSHFEGFTEIILNGSEKILKMEKDGIRYDVLVKLFSGGKLYQIKSIVESKHVLSLEYIVKGGKK